MSINDDIKHSNIHLDNKVQNILVVTVCNGRHWHTLTDVQVDFDSKDVGIEVLLQYFICEVYAQLLE